MSAALVVGESIKSTLGTTFDEGAKADYYLTDQLDDVDFPASLASAIRESDVVAAATGFTQLQARVDGTVSDVVALDFDQIASLLDLNLQEGSFVTNVANPVVVSVERGQSNRCFGR